MMSKRLFKTVTRTQGNNQALKDGTVSPEAFAFDFEEVPVLIDGFRRMVRNLEFDICEMAFTTYLCAKAHGVRFTALPIFLVRGFHHGAILHNVKSGVAEPKDLEGQRVGVNRGYTVTTGVWARGILQDEYSVDLDRVTWVLSGDEHVAAYRPPPNVVAIEPGLTMAALLADGKLPAAIGVETGHPDVQPLIPDALAVGLAALKARGHYPINHLVVVRDELLEANPTLANDVFAAFAAAKRLYVEALSTGRIEKPTPTDRLHQRVMAITGDPLPYGIAPNRKMIDQLIRHAVAQRIIASPVEAEQLFAPQARSLTA